MVGMEETQMEGMLTAVAADVNSSLLIFDNALMLRSPEIEIVMGRLSAGLKVMTDYYVANVVNVVIYRLIHPEINLKLQAARKGYVRRG